MREEEDPNENNDPESSNADEVDDNFGNYEQDFKNLYWSRVICVDRFQKDQYQRHQLL